MTRRTTGDRTVRHLAHVLALGGGADRPPPVDPPWDDLIRLGGPNLGPALWSAARGAGLLTPVPAPLRPHLASGGPRSHPAAVLEAAYEANAFRTADLFDQLGEVAAALADLDATPIALKGAGTVLAGAWTEPAERVMADLDLLVPPERAMAARDALLSLGYAEERPVWPSLHHLPALRRADRFGSLELHLRPMTNAWAGVLRAEEVAESAQGVVVGGATVLVPAPDVLVTHALAHAHLADAALSRRVIPLRATLEVWRIERRLGPVDWAAVTARLERVGRGQVVDRHRRMASVLLDGAHDPRGERLLAPALVMLRWPALRRARDRAWRVQHLLDVDRLQEFYGDDRRPAALRAHHLRQQAAKALRR